MSDNEPLPTAAAPAADALGDALRDPTRFVCLYGTTPPRADAPEDKVARAAERLAERLRGVALDGLVGYDVQDESGRTDEPRPFPYLPTLPAPGYAARLRAATGGVPTISYKCVARTPEQVWDDWLDEAATEFGVRYLSLVGRATSRTATPEPGISLTEAMTAAARHRRGFTVGGVVIPERHDPARTGRSESRRLLDKAAAGCAYFVSQAVYAPEASVALLRDYGHDCRERGVAPSRVVLTFTPCGRPETLTFLKWLGVRIPPEVEQALLGSPDPLATSLRACADGLRHILESCAGTGVPLGINVESVSIKKEEIIASIELVSILKDVAREVGLRCDR
jgi:5,10-methylenetetrahydrofolate reductase